MITPKFRNYLILVMLATAVGYGLLGLVMGEFNPILWDKKTRAEAAGGVVAIAILLWHYYYND